MAVHKKSAPKGPRGGKAGKTVKMPKKGYSTYHKGGGSKMAYGGASGPVGPKAKMVMSGEQTGSTKMKY